MNNVIVARETARLDARLDSVERVLSHAVISNPVVFTQRKDITVKFNDEDATILFANGQVGDLSRGFIKHSSTYSGNATEVAGEKEGQGGRHGAGQWNVDLPVIYSVNGTGFPYASRRSRFFMTTGKSVLAGGGDTSDINLGGTVDGILYTADSFGFNSGSNTITFTIPASMIPEEYEDDAAITDNGDNAEIKVDLSKVNAGESTGVQAVKDILGNPVIYILRDVMFTAAESVTAVIGV